MPRMIPETCREPTAWAWWGESPLGSVCTREYLNFGHELPEWWRSSIGTSLLEGLRWITWWPPTKVASKIKPDILVSVMAQVLGSVKLHSLIRPFMTFLVLQKYLLDFLDNFHIWRLSLQLSCGDTCQCFDVGEKSRNLRNGGNWFSNS